MENASAHVTVGSYGHVLYGYDVKLGGPAELVPAYSYEAHVGSVTAVAISGDTLVSGGADEFIKVYDLAKRVERGNLMGHEGTITALTFFGASHLLSGSEDGAVMVWDASSWDCKKVLRGHSAAVESVSIHPSGKLALSVGRDCTLQVWNLLKGRKAYVSKLKGAARQVVWVSTGESYAVVIGAEVLIYGTDSGDLVRTLRLPAPIQSVAFYDSGNRMVAGVNSDTLYFVCTSSGEVIHGTPKAHDVRVKNVAAFDGSGDRAATVFTSSSDGLIKVWNVSETDGEIACSCVSKVQNGGRLTCMAVRLTEPFDEAGDSEGEAGAAGVDVTFDNATPDAGTATKKKAIRSTQSKLSAKSAKASAGKARLSSEAIDPEQDGGRKRSKKGKKNKAKKSVKMSE